MDTRYCIRQTQVAQSKDTTQAWADTPQLAQSMQVLLEAITGLKWKIIKIQADNEHPV